MKAKNKTIYFMAGFIFFIMLICPSLHTNAAETSKYYFTPGADQEIYCGEEVVVVSKNITDNDYELGDSLLGDISIKFNQAKKLIFASGVTQVDTYFISACFPNVEEIYFSETVKTIGGGVYPLIANATIKKFEVAKKNPYFTAVDGVLYNKTKTILYIYPPASTNTSYAVPDTVKNISNEAFCNALNLKKVSFGSKVPSTNLGSICMGLQNVTEYSVAAKNPTLCAKKGVVFNKKGDTLLAFPAGKGAKYIIPKGTKTIGDYAFSRTKVKNLVISEGVTKLGEFVFGEASIVKISIPSTLTSLNGSLSFLYDLQEITVAKKNKYYASVDGILYNKKLTKILCYPKACKNEILQCPDSVLSIDLTLCNENVKQLVLSKNVKKIIVSEFYDSEHVFEKITLSPQNPYFSIYDGSLYNKEKTELLYYAGGEIAAFPNELTKINIHKLFSAKIKEIHISSYVSEINFDVFDGLFSIPTLETVIIEDNNKKYCCENGLIMNKAHTYVYDADRSLKELNLPEGIESINSGAIFQNENLERIVLPSTFIQKSWDIYWDMPLSNLLEVVVDSNNTEYASKDGVLYTKDFKTFILYPSKKTDPVYVMPEQLTDGDIQSLLNNRYITTISLSDGFGEFYYSNYNSRYSDHSEEYALKEILAGKSSLNYTSVQGILYNKDMTELIWYPDGNDMEEYTVPDSVTSLPGLLFNSHIKKLTLGKSVQSFDLWINDSYEQCSFILPALQEIVVDKMNKYYTAVDGILYDKALTKMILYPADSRNETITIPKTVKYIFAIQDGHYTLKTPVNGRLKTIVIEKGSKYLKSDGRNVYGRFGLEKQF